MDIQPFITTEAHQRASIRFYWLQVQAILKRVKREGELTNTGRLCRTWDAEVIKPEPGAVRENLYGERTS